MTAPDWIFPALFDEDQLSLYVGFVYVITHTATDRFYVGKKNLMAKRGKKVVPSNWRKYWGSSEALALDLKAHGHGAFKREIVAFCLTKGSLTYAEIEEQVRRNVLGAKLADGSPASYNRNIAGKYWPTVIGGIVR